MNLQGRPDRVPNQPLRDVFLASDKTPSDVAYGMGWVNEGPGRWGADTTWVNRTLGLKAQTNIAKGKRYHSFNSTMNIDQAKKMCLVFSVDFDELYDGLLPEQAPACHCPCGEPMITVHVTGLCGFCLEESDRLVAA